jgi:ATP-dependent DNA helicase RecG
MTDLTSIKGLGEKRIALLNSMGVYSSMDLLKLLPKSYIDFTNQKTISEVQDGELAALTLTVVNPPKFARSYLGKRVIVCKVKDSTGEMYLYWFNQPYMAGKYAAGQRIYAYGRVDAKKGKRLASPTVFLQKPDILPVYSVKKGISQALMRDIVKQALVICKSECEETLPKEILARYSLMSYYEAISELHNPTSADRLKQAKKRLVFEELILFRIAQSLARQIRYNKFAPALNTSNVLEFLQSRFAFSLTNGQHKVISEVKADIEKHMPMNRLVQGDVGSGKTVIAIYALLAAGFSGYQAAFLAPTEILAAQHYQTLKRFVNDEVCLLTGSVKKAEKLKIYEKIASGEIKYVVGTHALLQAGVTFRNLALIVCDEQQRFGVAQRAALISKGAENFYPHVLVMSATPIPRTLALVMYGDLDVSILNEMPHGRQKTKTYIVKTSKRADMYEYIESQAKSGEQCYVVCPQIDSDDEYSTISVIDTYEELKAMLDIPVGLLHGKMSAKNKQSAIEDFKAGKTKVLVSTSVIEVGVDIPNANIMVIESANRFGLSQLHQLRGRVGRGNKQSYCFLLSSNDSECERLKALTSTSNGFEIAQKDLELRGAGELLGGKQHGETELESLAIKADYETICLAKQVTDSEFLHSEKLINRCYERFSFLKEKALLN